MKKLKVEYRTWHTGLPPRHVRMERPGWGGELGHADGDKPQPWHCMPFVEASTYGLELVYPFKSTCRVINDWGTLKFEGNFSEDGLDSPPFKTFAEGHYGFTSSLDIKTDEDHVVRIEPHPRYYTDQTGEVPLAISGHIAPWWSRIFFVVFKAPLNGFTHVFKQGDPYAQILIVPRKVQYEIKEMNENDLKKRVQRDDRIVKYGKYISTHTWKDYQGNYFDNKYKILNHIYSSEGEEGVDKKLAEMEAEHGEDIKHIPPHPEKSLPRTKLIGRHICPSQLEELKSER